MTESRRIRMHMVVGLFLVFAIACGGGSGGAPAPGDPSTQAGAAEGGTSQAEEPADTGSGSGSGAAAGGLPSAGGPGGWCGDVARFADALDEDPGIGDEQELRAFLEDFTATLEELTRTAPDEIRGDMAVLAGFYRQWLDSPDLTPDVSPEQEAEVEAAFERIDAYLVERCGFDPDELGSDDDFAGEASDDPFAGQAGTVTLAGDVEASQTYERYDVSCFYDGAQFFVDLIPIDDGWGVNLVSEEGVALASGADATADIVVSPPFESDMADDGDWFETVDATLTFSDVGQPEEAPDGYAFVQVEGAFSGTAVNDLDGTMTVDVSGTFSCVSQLGG